MIIMDQAIHNASTNEASLSFWLEYAVNEAATEVVSCVEKFITQNKHFLSSQYGLWNHGNHFIRFFYLVSTILSYKCLYTRIVLNVNYFTSTHADYLTLRKLLNVHLFIYFFFMPKRWFNQTRFF